MDFDMYFVSPVHMSKNIYSGIWVLLSPRVFESLYFLFSKFTGQWLPLETSKAWILWNVWTDVNIYLYTSENLYTYENPHHESSEKFEMMQRYENPPTKTRTVLFRIIPTKNISNYYYATESEYGILKIIMQQRVITEYFK